MEEIFVANGITNDNVSCGTSSVSVLEENPSRAYAVFINDSEEIIYLALGEDAVVNKGIRLNANGGSYEITTVNMYKGAVNAIAASGSDNNLCYVEANDK